MRAWRGAAALPALLLLASGPAPARAPAPAAARACTANPLCQCSADHFACDDVPFHRFPETGAGAAHVSVAGARLGVLGEAALDGLALRTLVLVASRLHRLDPAALASMASTLASLDLGHNEFTKIPIEAMRDLKVLNWLNLQSNYVSELEADMDWGHLTDSLSVLTLSNNALVAVRAGALSPLRRLAQLDLAGNRLRAIAPAALPPSLAMLRLSDNLLPAALCPALAHLPRLRHLHLRNNALVVDLATPLNHSCGEERLELDVLDLSHNELDDGFQFAFRRGLRARRLLLDLNEFSSVPSFVAESGRVERLSMAHNKLDCISETMIRALKRHLEQLDLDRNELSSLPESVRELGRLRHLSLAYNRFTLLNDLPPHLHTLALAGNYFSSFPLGLRDLTPGTLSFLDLSYNQISQLSADSFGAWSTALSTLNLKGNRLAQLAADAFPAALPVRELLLSFNDLYHVHSDAFVNLTMLQVLELSSTLFNGDYPLGSLEDRLAWLNLDNNNIHYISSADVPPSLEYLNLDFNKITEFPSDIYPANSSYKLKELRLSYNYICKLNTDFFLDLKELESVDLSYNRLQNLSERSFSDLPNLVYLNIAGNVLEYINERTFSKLPKLRALELQENNLIEFSTEYFEDVSGEETPFAVNASRNRITSLSGHSTVLINMIDLSYNLIEYLTTSFFNAVGLHLRRLILSHNKLTHIDNVGFGALPKLQILSLRGNNISAVKRRAFAEMSSLQILDLSRNQVPQLAVEQFHTLRRLRHLRLDDNALRSLPRDVFRNTVLEHLDLSGNRLAMFPSGALAQVGFTLRRLELARNLLEHLDAAMLRAVPFVRELGLADNALTVLADNTFASLARLHRLDLSSNYIKSNFKELFHNLPKLRRLALAGVGLKTVPHLPLADLTELDLGSNRIASYREDDVRNLVDLRVLNLCNNRFTSLQPSMWAVFRGLATLGVAGNPVGRISRGSFEGLDRLQHLRAHDLRLDAVEPRAFRSLRSLRSLELDSPPGDVTVAAVLQAARSVESLTLHMTGTALDGQLLGLRAPRLRAVEVRGAALRRVATHAFASLGRQRTLALRVRGTGVASLPAGLLHPLARVPHLALDLSDNRLLAFGPAVLYPNLTGWNRLATKLLPGGLVLAGNPLRCGCSLSWVGAWLRRWTAEVGGGTRAARDAARRSWCVAGAGAGAGAGVQAGVEAVVPLLSLEADEAECHASALSSRAPRPPAPTARAALLGVVLLRALS